MGLKKYCSYEKVYNIAKGQFCRHRDMVSGVWSVSGEEFCERYGLDYQAAIRAEQEADARALEDEMAVRRLRAERIIGLPLTIEQVASLEKRVADEWGDNREREVFWLHLMGQLEELYPSYASKYLEEIGDE